MLRHLLCFLALSFSLANAQPSLINSGELLKKGYKLHDEGKYKEAITLYLQVNRSDTNYREALYELAFSSYMDSNFIACKNYAEKGLKLYPEFTTKWKLQLANAEEELGNFDKAIEIYNSILELNPNDYVTYFNLGVTYNRAKKYDEAKKNFQRCVLIYPFYTSAHYFLGLIAFEEGKPIQSLMSLATCLFINPENKYLSKSIGLISEITDVKDGIVAKTAKAKKNKEDNYELVQEILFSKAAFNRGYKLQSSLEDNIVRQLQVMMEKLEFNASDKGFWMQFYVPFFKQVYDGKNFEKFSYYIFSGLNSKSIKDYMKRNQKQVDAWLNEPIAYFNTIKETQELQVNKRENIQLRYLVNDKVVAGRGEWKTDAKSFTLLGNWELYYSNGSIKAKGKFNDKGEKEGEWSYYYDNGQIKEKSNYVNGVVEGPSTTWFDNGVQSTQATYKNGKVTGKVEYWFYNQAPKKTENYVDDVKTGVAKYYNNDATLKYETEYKEDKDNGTVTYYYINGNKQSSVNYTNNKANGIYKKYFYYGGVMLEGELKEDKKNGLWKEYYDNGKLKNEANYVEGEIYGVYKEYHSNGVIMQTAFYVKGKLDGKMEDFDDDGKVFSESLFEKGKLREIKFFDKTGKEISNTTTRRGAGNLTFYSATGVKNSEGFFSKDGMRQGKTLYFYPDGKTKIEAEFKDGNLQGLRKAFYMNGNLSDEVNYTNDEKDGYYTAYYINKVKKYEGWILKGNNEGEHIEYDKLGNIHSKTWYLEGEQYGYTEYYHPNGKIDYEQKWENGWVRKVTQFDTTGKIIDETDLPKGNGNFLFKHFNGNKYVQGTYKNNHLHGNYQTFYFDGSTDFVTTYNQARYDGAAKKYYYGGILAYEGNYKLGDKDGLWKYYHPNGKLHYAETYVKGNLNGPCVIYNSDGSKDKEMTYVDGNLEGAYKLYGANNELIYQLNYHDDDIVSYTYEGKDGILVKPILTGNGTFILTAYYKNGVKSADINFENYLVNGKRNLFYSNGKPYIESKRIYGYDDGVKKVYYSSGQLQKEETYYNDVLHGIQKHYHTNGKIMSEEMYHLGELHGTCKYYDATGKLIDTKIYFYDILQLVKNN